MPIYPFYREPWQDVAFEALAESWAAIDGKLDEFRACKADMKLDDTEGYYQGYLSDTHILLNNLRERGFMVAPIEEPS